MMSLTESRGSCTCVYYPRPITHYVIVINLIKISSRNSLQFKSETLINTCKADTKTGRFKAPPYITVQSRLPHSNYNTFTADGFKTQMASLRPTSSPQSTIQKSLFFTRYSMRLLHSSSRTSAQPSMKTRVKIALESEEC